MNTIENLFISFLIDTGKINKTDLEKFLSLKGTRENFSLEEHLLSSGLLKEHELRSSLKEFYVVPLASKHDFPEEPVLINTLSVQFMREYEFMGVPKILTKILN